MMYKKIRYGSAIFILLNIFALPALAAANGTTSGFDSTGMLPSFSSAWGGLPDFVKTKITWILGILLVLFVVIAVAYSITSGGGALLSSHSGDVAGRSRGISNMFLGVGVILVAMMAIAIIGYLVM